MDQLGPEQRMPFLKRALESQSPVCPYCGRPGISIMVHGDTENSWMGTTCKHRWDESDLQETPAHVPAPDIGMETREHNKVPRRVGFGAILAVAVFCANRGYSAVNASPSWIIGTAWFAGAAALLVAAVWMWEHTTKWHWGRRLALSVVLLAGVYLAAFGPVSDQYKREHTVAPPAAPPVVAQATQLAPEQT